MYKLIIFAITMLILSSICNGQGVSNFGATRAQDTSRTVAQVKLTAYGGSLDTMLMIILPNGDVKKVAKNAFGSNILAGYGLLKTGNTIYIDTSIVVKYSDTAAMLAPYLRTAWDSAIYTGGYLTLVDSNNRPTAKSNVLILTGQSNAVGVFNPGQALGLLPVQYRGEQQKEKIWWYGAYNTPVAGHFEKMFPMNNTFDSSYTNPSSIYFNMVGWGTEQATARKLQGAFNDTLYVVKSALNGLNITNWASPSGTMWLKLSQAITQSLTALDAIGRPVVPRGIVWMQGEADATEGIGALYEGRLRTVIANIRALDARLATVPFVMVKLRAGTLTQVKVDTINNAFNTLAGESPYNITVDPTLVGSTLYDGTHYGGDMILLGNAIADTIVAHSQLPPYTVAIPNGTVTQIKVTDGNGFDMNVDGATTIPTLALGLQSGYQLMVNSTSQTFTGDKTFTGQTVVTSPQAFPFRVISSFPGNCGITLGAGTGRAFTITLQENNSDRGYFGYDPAAAQLFWANSVGKGINIANTTGFLTITDKIKSYAGAAPTNGQLLIGHTANGTFEKATLTAGTGIDVTSGAGSITVATNGNATVTTTSAGTLSPSASGHYVFTGTTSTWTLPAVSGTSGRVMFIKNRGSGTVTINTTAAANELYSSSAVNTYALTAGSAIILVSDGTMWNVE